MKFGRITLSSILGSGLFALFTVLQVSTVNAQTDWFSMGKELLDGLTTDEGAISALSNEDISAGLKEALRVGSETVVGQLGKSGGFDKDPQIHIPLPESLDTVRSGLATIGMASVLDDLEAKLNSAAEVATPKAKALFLDAIQQMTIDDVTGIYNGPDNAATTYFQKKMSDSLAKEMQPVVSSSLSEVGAVQLYKKTMGQYESLPFVPKVEEDLTNYVVDNGMAGIFHYLAVEEAKIRNDPLNQSTELLKKVFGTSK